MLVGIGTRLRSLMKSKLEEQADLLKQQAEALDRHRKLVQSFSKDDNNSVKETIQMVLTILAISAFIALILHLAGLI